jgi:hypothetical protein
MPVREVTHEHISSAQVPSGPSINALCRAADAANKLNIEKGEWQDKEHNGTYTTYSETGEPYRTKWVYEYINRTMIRIYRNGTFFHFAVKCD